MTPIKDFAVSSAATGFDEFLKVLSIHIGLSTTKNELKGNYKYYGFGNNKPKCFDEAWWTTNIISPSEAIALLTGKQLTERERDFRNGTCRNCRPEECTNNCYHTQESVKGIEFDSDDAIDRNIPLNPLWRCGAYDARIMVKSMRDRCEEKYTQQTAHLQQQLRDAKELLIELESYLDDEVAIVQAAVSSDNYACINDAQLPSLYLKINQFLTRNK